MNLQDKRRGLIWVGQLIQDIHFALRTLRKNIGFTTVVVLSLAIGIGANATVLCWIQNIIRQPLPGVANQEQLVVLTTYQRSGNVSLPDLRDIGELKEVFAGTEASQVTPASLTVDNKTEWIYGQVATANFFDMLGVKPIAGRTFLPDEDQKPGGDAVLVLSEEFWRTRFSADLSVIGKIVDLNRCSFTIIGVAQKGFQGTITGLACDFWAPVSMYSVVASHRWFDMEDRNSRGFHNLARLQPGVTIEQAQAAVAALDSRLARDYPNTNREVRHRVLPLSECPWGAQTIMGPVLRLLLAVSLGVLLIVSANVATLLLARSADRQKEIAIRMANGAGRWRVIRQLLTESVLLSLLGGAGGLLLAIWTTGAVSGFVNTTQMPVAMNWHIDATTLGLTLFLTVASGLVFGLSPALQASRMNLSNALKEDGRSSSGGAAHNRLRHALVIAEVALALVLLIGAGLCIKGLQKARSIDVGLDSNQVLIAGLQIGMNGYTEETGKVFYKRLQQRLAALPGVEDAAFASWFPLGLGGCKGLGVEVPGYVRPPGESPDYKYAIVSPRYFSTMKIPLVTGRDFRDSDDAGTAPVAIVNEYFAGKFWPDQDPVGRTFWAAGKLWTVVGVAKAGKYNSLDESPLSFFYIPFQQFVPDLDLNICLRVKGDPQMMVETVHREVHALDANVELWGAMPLTDHCEGAFMAQRIASRLLALLGIVALLLAAMGVYGVMSYAVRQRTQEFGIRLALGASRHNLLGLVVGRGMMLALTGLVIGLVLALSVSRLLAAFLYGISPYDPLTFICITLFLAIVALTACYLPALRVTKLDPMTALRCE